MKINNFVHDEGKVTFEVLHENKTNVVEIIKTQYGASMTDIDSFTSDWDENTYDQLDSFANGCTDIVNCFFHN